jgi:hypothetical protein
MKSFDYRQLLVNGSDHIPSECNLPSLDKEEDESKESRASENAHEFLAVSSLCNLTLSIQTKFNHDILFLLFLSPPLPSCLFTGGLPGDSNVVAQWRSSLDFVVNTESS